MRDDATQPKKNAIASFSACAKWSSILRESRISSRSSRLAPRPFDRSKSARNQFSIARSPGIPKSGGTGPALADYTWYEFVAQARLERRGG